MHYIASPKTSSGASSQKNIFGFRCARDAKDPIATPSISDEKETHETCPLCGGEFIEFDLKDSFKLDEGTILLGEVLKEAGLNLDGSKKRETAEVWV